MIHFSLVSCKCDNFISICGLLSSQALIPPHSTTALAWRGQVIIIVTTVRLIECATTLMWHDSVHRFAHLKSLCEGIFLRRNVVVYLSSDSCDFGVLLDAVAVIFMTTSAINVRSSLNCDSCVVILATKWSTVVVSIISEIDILMSFLFYHCVILSTRCSTDLVVSIASDLVSLSCDSCVQLLNWRFAITFLCFACNSCCQSCRLFCFRSFFVL